MKPSDMGVRSTALGVTIAILLIPAAAAFAQDCNEPPRNPQNMHIEVDNNGNPYFVDNLCPGKAGSRNGDMCNAKGARPRIEFKLRGANATNWKLVRMELSGDGSTFPDSSLPCGAYLDFEYASIDDRELGHPKVYLNPNANQMTVNNNNCVDFHVHYRVVLEDPAGGEHILHPVIDNNGRQ